MLNNNNNRRLVTLAEHTSDHGKQTNSMQKKFRRGWGREKRAERLTSCERGRGQLTATASNRFRVYLFIY